MVTMRELADALGLTPGTVSRALDPAKSHMVRQATRLRVIEAAEAAGYTPDPAAAGLRRGRTSTVGILAPDLGNETIVTALRGIASVLDRDDLTPLIAESMDDPGRSRRILERFRSRRVDAIVTLAATDADAELLTRLSRSVPVVVAVRTLNTRTLPTVCSDDARGGALAAYHLGELGHREVAQIRGPGEAATFRLRASGFADGCAQRRLVVVSDVRADHATIAEGRRLTAALLDDAGHDPPTALFAHNDALAIGAVEAVRSRGLRVPDDISIIGFNNTLLGREIAVPLTTVDYPAELVGVRAGELATQLVLGGRVSSTPVIFPLRLLARRSTAPPPSR